MAKVRTIEPDGFADHNIQLQVELRKAHRQVKQYKLFYEDSMKRLAQCQNIVVRATEFTELQVADGMPVGMYQHALQQLRDAVENRQ